MIIDYHSHIKWDRDTNQYDTAALLQDMEENQIDKRVVSALAGFSTREQNGAVAELVKANPGSDHWVCSVKSQGTQAVLKR